jgi:hypothetical protein
MTRAQGWRRYTRAISTVVGRSAIPYGYTLTIWASGAALESSHQTPTIGDAFLFLVGATAGFGAVGLIAQAQHDRSLEPQRGDLTHTGRTQVVAATLAFGAAALIGKAHTILVWPAGAFAATVIYLMVTAIALTLAMDAARRR